MNETARAGSDSGAKVWQWRLTKAICGDAAFTLVEVFAKQASDCWYRPSCCRDLCRSHSLLEGLGGLSSVESF